MKANERLHDHYLKYRYFYNFLSYFQKEVSSRTMNLINVTNKCQRIRLIVQRWTIRIIKVKINNRTRQAVITKELIEIISGAAALD